ncbi:MAG: thiamine pyrophosphate-dependent dehydrogenase E1 component subunit alpha [Bacilli bacterium]
MNVDIQHRHRLETVYTARLRTMYLIRYFDEKVDELFLQGRVHGTTHLYVGEEAIATGACAVIEDADYITSTHRGHGHCIAKGASVEHMMAEILGRATGYCKGKGGSMHIADVDSGNLGANGIVAGGIPIAVGAGLTSKMKGSGRVVLCFFGDGAVNEGAFHESMNLASIWRLPVIFICENNQYGMSGSVKSMTNIPNLALRAESYGMPGLTVDGNDVMAVDAIVANAVLRARGGEGPTFIEAVTYRWKGHSKSDARAYRTREEEREWKDRDPIVQFRKQILAEGISSEAALDEIGREAMATIEAAVDYAEASPFPAEDELEQDVYA